MQSSPDATFLARTADIVAAAGLLLIVVCSVPSLRRIAHRFIPRHRLREQPIAERYEDEDGTATAESEAAYSYQLPRVVVLLLSVICLLDSLVLCVITTRSQSSALGVGQWLQFGAWVCSVL